MDLTSDYPIFIDQHGRILGGRHREKAAEKAGVTPRHRQINVKSDTEALVIAYYGNIGCKNFTKKEEEEIAADLFAAGIPIHEIIGPVGVRKGSKRNCFLIESVEPSDCEKSRLQPKYGYRC